MTHSSVLMVSVWPIVTTGTALTQTPESIEKDHARDSKSNVMEHGNVMMGAMSRRTVVSTINS